MGLRTCILAFRDVPSTRYQHHLLPARTNYTVSAYWLGNIFTVSHKNSPTFLVNKWNNFAIGCIGSIMWSLKLVCSEWEMKTLNQDDLFISLWRNVSEMLETFQKRYAQPWTVLFKIQLRFLSDNRAFTYHIISKIPGTSSEEVSFKDILDVIIPV